MEMLKSWAVNIITVMMIASFAEILMPDGTFKKYSKLVIGVIVMIMIIQPFIQLAHADMTYNMFAAQAAQTLNVENVRQQSNQLKETQTKQITETYKNQICDQIAQKIQTICKDSKAEVKVEIQSDPADKTFGTIRYIDALILQEDDPGSAPERATEGKQENKIAKIKPVSISSEANETENTQTIVEVDGQLRDRIVDSIKSAYNVPAENIKLQIQKK